MLRCISNFFTAFTNVNNRKKTIKEGCQLCFCERRLQCVHLCEECAHIINKYYPYEDCPYCLEIFEPRVKLAKNPIVEKK
jgi:hypothetical protein